MTFSTFSPFFSLSYSSSDSQLTDFSRPRNLQVAVIVFGQNDKLFEFASSNIDDILVKYTARPSNFFSLNQQSFLLCLFVDLLRFLFSNQTTDPSITRARPSLLSLLLPTQVTQLQIRTRERKMRRMSLQGRRARRSLLLREGRKSLECPTVRRGCVSFLSSSLSPFASISSLLSSLLELTLHCPLTSPSVESVLNHFSTTSLSDLPLSHSRQHEHKLRRSKLSSRNVLSTQQPSPVYHRPSPTSHVPTSTSITAATRSIRPAESAAADLAAAARIRELAR